MLYDDILIQSEATGAAELVGTFKKAHNPIAAALFAHNSSGTKDENLFLALEDVLNKSSFNTLRFNFHYVGKKTAQEALFEDLQKDFDAAYSKLLAESDVPNLYLIGKSLGGLVALNYALDNRLRCPVIVLGFHRPGSDKYIKHEELKNLKSPLLIVHGEFDQYTNTEATRQYFNEVGLTFDLHEVKGANHGLTSNDEVAKPTSAVVDEVLSTIVDFINRN